MFNIEDPARVRAALRVVFYAIIPTIAVGCWGGLKPSEAGAQSALLSLIVLPLGLFPVAWTVSVLFDLVDVGEHLLEFAAMAAVSLLAAIIVLPTLAHTVEPAAPVAFVGWSVLLVCLWVPLLAASTWAPIAVADYEALERRQHPSPNPSRFELARILGGLVLAVAVPFGMFVPLYLGADHTTDGEAAMIVFAVGCHVAGFVVFLAPRLAMRLALVIRVGPTRDTPERIVKLVWGCAVLPATLLGLYRYAEARPAPQRALLMCLVLAPPLTVLEVLRLGGVRGEHIAGWRGAAVVIIAVYGLGLLTPTLIAFLT